MIISLPLERMKMTEGKSWGFLKILEEGMSPDEQSYCLKKIVVLPGHETELFKESQEAALIIVSGRGSLRQDNKDYSVSRCLCVIPAGDEFNFACSGETPLVIIVTLMSKSNINRERPESA